MAGSAERQTNFAEKTGETVRNAGIIAALLGAVAWAVNLQIGATIFVAGAAAGAAGEIARRAAGPAKTK